MSGRGRKYPWNVWLRDPRTKIVHGVDYVQSQSSMCQMIRNAASKRGVSVQLEDKCDSIVIEVRRTVSDNSHPHPTAVTTQQQDALEGDAGPQEETETINKKSNQDVDEV